MKNKIILPSLWLLLFWCAYPVILKAQENSPMPKIALPSANAAALGKYGDIPVSDYTGIPQISIPLGNVYEQGLNLPISLSYHASGIKVDEVVSNVGLGWSLNAGGVITRTVKGKPDEGANGYAKYDFDIQNATHVTGVASGILDAEPDVYFFNVAGYSGKFYFDRVNGELMPRIIPYQDIKIEKTSTGWVLTTTDGTKYVFDEKEYTDSESGASNYTHYVTGWYLSRIEDFRGNKITFEYIQQLYSYTAGLSETQTLTTLNNSALRAQVSGCDCEIPSGDKTLTYVTIIGLTVSKIKTSFETIELE
ncbi:MAG: hypothetical protein RLZZ628_591 [Bacteroidota bacterium]|jgi:hypothetical protein